MPRPDGYIPEDEREPVQKAIVNVNEFEGFSYFAFPLMQVSTIEIFNSQNKKATIDFDYTNGKLRITIIEEMYIG